MRTRIVEETDLEWAATLLKRGELVAFPTETVYGLGACVFSEEAIAAVFRAKGRPSDNPLIVHVHSLEQVLALSRDIPPCFYRLVEHFWPGPLTCVLRRHPCVPSSVSGGLDSVAVRMPSHPLALALLRLVGEPLVAPSANLSGRPSPTTARHVLEDLEGRISAVVEGGKAEVGVESTVVSLLGPQPVLLRPGAITAEAIEDVLRVPVIKKMCCEGGEVLSPGMKYRHYAPRCPVIIVGSKEELLSLLSSSHKRRMVLASSAICSLPNAPVFSLSSATFYALLRQADREEYEEVVVVCDETIRKDEALFNRLTKAAGKDTIPVSC